MSEGVRGVVESGRADPGKGRPGRRQEGDGRWADGGALGGGESSAFGHTILPVPVGQLGKPWSVDK